MADHRVPLLGDAWRRFEEPETSRDPRIRQLVSQLNTLALAPEPSADFRADLRAQLVAITPRIVAESLAEDASMIEIVPRRTAPVDSGVPEVVRKRLPLGRVIGIAACVVTAFAVLLGGALAMSRNALPGDTLYGLKRAAERFELATDGNDSDRAADLLSFAGTRADEARQLIADAQPAAESSATVDPHTVSLVRSTLDSANSDLRQATSMLARKAVADHTAGPLAAITQWAPAQMKRLQAIDALPAARDDSLLRQLTAASTSLVSQAQRRAQALIPHIAATCMSDTTSDQLGLVPCTAASTTTGRSTAPKHATATPPAPGAAVRTGSPVSTGTGTPVSVPQPGRSLGTTATPTKTSPLLPIPSNLPTVPVTLPGQTDPIIKVDPSGVCVTIGGIKLNLGACTSPTP